MVISYDNLIVRLWVHGAILPFVKGGYAAEHSKINLPKDFYDETLQSRFHPSLVDASNDGGNLDQPKSTEEDRVNDEHIDTLINESGSG